MRPRPYIRVPVRLGASSRVEGVEGREALFWTVARYILTYLHVAGISCCATCVIQSCYSSAFDCLPNNASATSHMPFD